MTACTEGMEVKLKVEKTAISKLTSNVKGAEMEFKNI